ncbi:ArsA-related P-loop ATPase [Streptomyces roseicoloratus]|uniref:ArsA-related P-loop ATPase n=1 Tax=Streptomyces roseicoloratus TaxID=2508722 RepID=A0ABY9S0W9_9ACTN|nr:ArsA-related P-loop ATPase [Streptomyces roseicoloratus]WMX47476.1 ArsA-related P-loop ATPase [Streptomyces roseicoloratus]
MWITLVTGTACAGRTSVALGTALAEARAGRRVLLVSADADPAAVAGEDLSLLAPDPAADFRREFLALQARSTTALDLLGAAPFEDAELTELPGSRDFALLRSLRDAAAGDWDLAVVELPPVTEALALLALPAQLRRYLRRLLPPERQAARALRPMLAQLAGVPLPAQWLYETTARWEAELAAVQDVLDAPGTAVRLVVEPGPAAEEALRTARLGLALHGLAMEGVVANRVLPADSPDPWFAGLAAEQHRHLAALRETQPGLHELPHLGRALRGPEDLALLAVTAPATGAAPAAPPEWTVEDRRDEDGILVWHVPLPGAVKDGLSLVRRGDELLLGAGPFRRAVPLPAVLRRCTVTGAGLVDGDLRIRFTPDPGLWPRTAP